MYVPTTLAQPAGALAPIVISASTTPPLQAPAHTSLRDIRSDLNVLEGHATSVTGKLTAAPISTTGASNTTVPDPQATAARAAGLARRMVTLQALGNHGWRTLAGARTNANGRFRLRYMPHENKSELVRLHFAGDTEDRGAHRRLGRLDVYRLAEASWYGGGGELACGGELTSSTLGVANKTLPCGTEVTLRYDGRSVEVRVVDRGPYVAGREFDLTEATKQALGFGDLGEVWSTR
jgi:rare lipoprotein A